MSGVCPPVPAALLCRGGCGLPTVGGGGGGAALAAARWWRCLRAVPPPPPPSASAPSRSGLVFVRWSLVLSSSQQPFWLRMWRQGQCPWGGGGVAQGLGI